MDQQINHLATQLINDDQIFTSVKDCALEELLTLLSLTDKIVSDRSRKLRQEILDALHRFSHDPLVCKILCKTYGADSPKSLMIRGRCYYLDTSKHRELNVIAQMSYVVSSCAIYASSKLPKAESLVLFDRLIANYLSILSKVAPSYDIKKVRTEAQALRLLLESDFNLKNSIPISPSLMPSYPDFKDSLANFIASTNNFHLRLNYFPNEGTTDNFEVFLKHTVSEAKLRQIAQDILEQKKPSKRGEFLIATWFLAYNDHLFEVEPFLKKHTPEGKEYSINQFVVEFPYLLSFLEDNELDEDLELLYFIRSITADLPAEWLDAIEAKQKQRLINIMNLGFITALREELFLPEFIDEAIKWSLSAEDRLSYQQLKDEIAQKFDPNLDWTVESFGRFLALRPQMTWNSNDRAIAESIVDRLGENIDICCFHESIEEKKDKLKGFRYWYLNHHFIRFFNINGNIHHNADDHFDHQLRQEAEDPFLVLELPIEADKKDVLTQFQSMIKKYPDQMKKLNLARANLFDPVSRAYFEYLHQAEHQLIDKKEYLSQPVSLSLRSDWLAKLEKYQNGRA